MAEAQERLKHLISQLEAMLEGEQKRIKPFAVEVMRVLLHENQRSDSRRIVKHAVPE